MPEGSFTADVTAMRKGAAGEFTEHAESERGHAMRAAERVSQLGGDPDFDEEEHADDLVDLLLA